MKIAGKYVAREDLAKWTRIPKRGDAPALWVEFEFPALIGSPERLSMWGMVDTGAEDVVVPGLPLGVSLDSDGKTPRIVPGSGASRLALTPWQIGGIGGVVEGLSAVAKIKVGGQQLTGSFRIVISSDLPFPLIGRPILNRYLGLFHQVDNKVLLADRCQRWRTALAALIPIYGRAD